MVSRLPAVARRSVLALVVSGFVLSTSFVAGAGAGLVGCAPPQSAADIAIDKLPKYEGRSPILYPDVLEPAAVGLSLDPLSLKADPLYRERVQQADGVARMRVVTVTSEDRGGALSYRLQFAVVDKRLGGTDASTRVEVEVKPGTNAYGVVRKLGERLTNKMFIVSWKRFQVAGEGVVHYYAAPDDDETRSATHEALVLQEVKGQ
jgi:hypothetical protein